MQYVIHLLMWNCAGGSCMNIPGSSDRVLRYYTEIQTGEVCSTVISDTILTLTFEMCTFRRCFEVYLGEHIYSTISGISWLFCLSPWYADGEGVQRLYIERYIRLVWIHVNTSRLTSRIDSHSASGWVTTFTTGDHL